jgi:hypothetical protein
MKNQLLELGLSETIADEILEIWDIHLKTVERYDKPGGIIEFRDNLSEIERLSKKLSKKLQALSSFERQILIQTGAPGIFNFSRQAGILSLSCTNAKKTKSRFSRREPFLRQLTIELWNLLERRGIAVTVYKSTALFNVLNILLDEPPDSQRAFNLIRDVGKRFKKTAKNHSL